MTPEPPARSLSGRSAAQLEDRRGGRAERRLLGDPFIWRRRGRRTAIVDVEPSRQDEVEAESARWEGANGAERLLLGAWDLVVVLLALVITDAFGGGFRGWIAKLLICVASLVVINGAGGYRRTAWLHQHPLEIFARLIAASTVLAWFGVLITLAFGLHTKFGPLVITWLVLPVLWYAGRRFATTVVRRARPERVLILGSGVVARRVMELAQRTGSASVVVGCLDDDVAQNDAENLPLLGGVDQLPRLLQAGGIDRVIVAFSSRRDYDTLDVLRSCASYRGSVDVVPRFFDFVGPHAKMYRADELAFLSIPGRHPSRGHAALKRAIDIAGATFLLVALSPLLLLISAVILIDSGPPVLFRQRRIGMHGTPFSILKLRTLAPPGDPHHERSPLELTPESIAIHVEQAKQEATRRATRVGAFLRKTSLDELPQLFNVLVGQMSLVGPRPLSPLEDAALEGWEALRRDMRPGITGLWQVSGRSEISWENRINLDYSQVRHWSLSADLLVLADTVRAVLRRRGAE